jgi:hypothetical protein
MERQSNAKALLAIRHHGSSHAGPELSQTWFASQFGSLFPRAASSYQAINKISDNANLPDMIR